MNDRSKPPKGYSMTHTRVVEFPWRPEVGQENFRTEEAAVAACWAHHDAIEARGYARCQADVVAEIASRLTNLDLIEPVRLTLLSMMATVQSGHHVGAAERAKESTTS